MIEYNVRLKPGSYAPHSWDGGFDLYAWKSWNHDRTSDWSTVASEYVEHIILKEKEPASYVVECRIVGAPENETAEVHVEAYRALKTRASYQD